MPTELEADWVLHAHKMVTDWRHIETTRHMYGSMNHPQLDGENLRWPGYFGPNVVKGDCVLAIGNIHRGFLSGDMAFAPGGPGAVTDLVEATRRLQAQPVATPAEMDAYLIGHRAAYRLGLGEVWKVRRRLLPALEYCSATLDELVYVNASCCQFPEGDDVPAEWGDPDDLKDALKVECLKRHSLQKVIDIIQPKVVLSMCKEATAQLADPVITHNADVVVSYHQWFGTLTRPLTIDGQVLPRKANMNDVWGPAVQRHLANR